VLYQCGRGPYDGLITRPEESYQCNVSEYDRETSTMSSPWPTGGCHLSAKGRVGREREQVMSLCHTFS